MARQKTLPKQPASRKRKSKRQQRLEARAKAARRQRIRIIGFVLLGAVVLTGIFFWRRAGEVPLEELQASTGPNRIGPEDAPVQIVEYGDFGCPSCRLVHNSGLREQILAKFGDQVSFEFRHFPVITQQSPKAAEAGQCAAEQGAFWEYHDYIYESTPQNALSVANLKSYARAIGLDQAIFDECLDSGKYAPFVRNDWQAARSDGASGTPTFLLNGQRVTPFYNEMAARIEQILGG